MKMLYEVQVVAASADHTMLRVRELTILLFILIVSRVSMGQELLFTFVGQSSGDCLGFSVESAGDVNSDGVSDVIAGAPDTWGGPNINIAAGIGSIHVFSGASGQQMHTVAGTYSLEYFGLSVCSAGDVNADGFDDFVVGAPFHSPGMGIPGLVRVYSGQSGLPLQSFMSVFPSNSAFGRTVVRVSDIDGDGVSELAVSAPTDLFSSSSTVFPYSAILNTVTGATMNLQLGGTSAAFYVGISLSDVGDIDGDGVVEVATGIGANWFVRSRNAQTAAHVTTVAAANVACPIVPGGGCGFGWSLAGIGDTDGNGVPEYAVGARGDLTHGAQAGAVYVFEGTNTTPVRAVFGDAAGDRFGSSLCSNGDFNGDGIRDFAVGAEQYQNNLMQPEYQGTTGPGYVRVYSGDDASLIATLQGPAYDCGFGHAIAFLPDINGDGADELIVGAPRYDTLTLTDCGAVFVIGGIPQVSTSQGNVGVSQGIGPIDVLTLDGQSGGLSRRVNRGYGAPVVLNVSQPPTLPVPGRVALFLTTTQPNTNDVTSTPFGNFSFIPAPLAPWDFRLATVVNGFWNDPRSLHAATLLPYSQFVQMPMIPFQVVLQGLVEQDASISLSDLAVTNAVTLIVP